MVPHRVLLFSLLVVCFPAYASAQCDPAFVDAVRYAVSDVPYALVAADFDSDGRVDLATMGRESDKVDLLTNRPEGLFGIPPIVLPAPALTLLGPVDVKDGSDDLIAVGSAALFSLDRTENTMFEIAVTEIDGDPLFNHAAAADLDGDDRVDVVAIAKRGAGSTAVYSLRVFIANPGGTFTETGPALPLAGSVYDITAGDLTGDGNADVLLADRGAGKLLAGNGDGSFQGPQSLIAGEVTQTVRLGDFDDDGQLDLLAGSALVLSTQPGSKQRLQFISSGVPVDLDGDGRLDIFSSAAIARGNGDGTFAFYGHDATTGFTTTVPAFADLDGDSTIDIAYGTSWNDVAIHHNRGPLQYEGSQRKSVAQPHLEALAGDLDGDGRDDVVAVSAGESAIYLANADGSLIYDSRIQAQATAGALGDFDGDGKLDLFLDGKGVAFGNGDGTFGEMTAAVGVGESSAATAADVNGDGSRDIVSVGAYGGVAFLVNDGTGRFSRTMTELPPALSVAAADFDGDGKDDVVIGTSESQEGEIHLIRGSLLQSPLKIADGVQAEALAVGDVDGDGMTDVITLSDPIDEILIFPGNGNGTFRTAIRVNVADEIGVGAVTVADFTQDGRLDFVVTSLESFQATLFVQQTDGSFSESAHVPSLGYGGRAADFDGDGRMDLLLQGGGLGTFRVHMNRCRQELRVMPPVVRLSADRSFSIAGEEVNFTADVDPAATGTVTFYDTPMGSGSSVNIGTVPLSGGRATLASRALGKGRHEIHAVYSGEGRFASSRSGMVEHFVTAGRRRAVRR